MNVFIHLPSWVKNYLNKHKTHCKVQEANIGHMGDKESLFAGDDACEHLKKLIDKADSD